MHYMLLSVLCSCILSVVLICIYNIYICNYDITSDIIKIQYKISQSSKNNVGSVCNMSGQCEWLTSHVKR